MTSEPSIQEVYDFASSKFSYLNWKIVDGYRGQEVRCELKNKYRIRLDIGKFVPNVYNGEYFVGVDYSHPLGGSSGGHQTWEEVYESMYLYIESNGSLQNEYQMSIFDVTT